MPPRVEALDAAALIAQLQAHSAEPDMQADCCYSLSESGQLSDEAALSFLPAIVAAMCAHTLTTHVCRRTAVHCWD
jgi:hypothetical protein